MTTAHTLVSSPREAGPGAAVLFAGPLGWFVELNIGYVLATEPCFPGDHRLVVPKAAWAWTHAGLLVLAALCALIALWGFILSLRALPHRSGSAHSFPVVTNRPEFAALWGAAFGGGFLVATLLTGVGLFLLPRCGG